MGPRHPRAISDFNPALEGWQRVDSTLDSQNWINPSTGEEIEQYKFILGSQEEFAYEADAFAFRLNSPVLVASRYLRKEVRNELCSSMLQGDMFLERIPLRLSKIKEIPFPDILHLYSQAFKGFNLLQKQVGPFQVNEDMIGINTQGVVKVWVNSDFCKSLPERSFEVATLTQRDMVSRVVEIIDLNTYQPVVPSNIMEFFRKKNISTFNQAEAALVEYAGAYGANIPYRMECVLQEKREAGGIQHGMMTFGSALGAANIQISHVQPVIQQTSVLPTHVSFRDPTRIPVSYPVPTIASQKQIISTQAIEPIINRAGVRQQIVRPKSYRSPSPLIRHPSVPAISSAIHKPSPTKLLPHRTSEHIPAIPRPFASQVNITHNAVPAGPASQTIIGQSFASVTKPYTSDVSFKDPMNHRKSSANPIQRINNRPVPTNPAFFRDATPTKANTHFKSNTSRVGQVHYLLSRSRPQCKPPAVQTNIPKQKVPAASLWQRVQKPTLSNRLNYHQPTTNKPYSTYEDKNMHEQKTSSNTTSALINKFRQRTPTPSKYPNPSGAISYQKIQQVNTNDYRLPGPISPHYPPSNYPVHVPPGETYIGFQGSYLSSQSRYQHIQDKADKTTEQIMNIIRESREQYNNLQIQMQAEKAEKTNYSFAVERFAPNTAEIYTYKNQTKAQTNIPQIAGSEYLTSLYVPMNARAAQAELLPNHGPFSVPATITETNYIEFRQSYAPQFAQSKYTHTNNYNQLRTDTLSRPEFQRNYHFHGGSPASYAWQRVEEKPNYSNASNDSRGQIATSTYNRIPADYQGMDAQLLDDLQRIRANLPLNR